jgi:(p)ppGpp synthase/HD superfamily hydrolase
MSGKARSSIRSFLKDQKQTEMIIFGERLLTTALARLSINLEVLPKKALHPFLTTATLDSVEDLYESIGRGERNSVLVAKQLAQTLDGQYKHDTASKQTLSIKGIGSIS